MASLSLVSMHHYSMGPICCHFSLACWTTAPTRRTRPSPRWPSKASSCSAKKRSSISKWVESMFVPLNAPGTAVLFRCSNRPVCSHSGNFAEIVCAAWTGLTNTDDCARAFRAPPETPVLLRAVKALWKFDRPIIALIFCYRITSRAGISPYLKTRSTGLLFSS